MHAQIFLWWKTRQNASKGKGSGPSEILSTSKAQWTRLRAHARDFKHYCCNPHLGNDPEWLPEKRENQYLWGLCQTASELQNMRMRAVETQRHLKRRFWSPLESRIEIWWFWASFCLVSLLLMTARLESNNAIITWAVLKNKHRCPITTISNQTTVTIVTSQSHFKTDSQGKRSDSRH